MNKKITKISYIIVFCILITLPLFQFKTKIFKVKALDEKRQKIAKPSYNEKHSADKNYTLKEFFKDYDSYIKDNFGFRESLIRLSNKIDLSLFKKSTSTKVVIGKDDYLYIDEEIGDFDRATTLPDNKIEEIALNIKSFQDELSKRGIDFLFAIAPNKSTIYPEYMSRPSLNKNIESNYDKLSKALIKHGVKYIDFRAILLSYKDKYPLYYKRDTHWNKISASIISDSVLKTLGKNKGVDGGINVGEVFEAPHEGDLDGLLGVDSKIKEVTTTPIIKLPSKFLPKTICYYDSFSYEVLPLLNEFSSQRVDLHNLNSPLYFTYPFFYTNTKVVFYEIVERYIDKLEDYQFNVFDDDVKFNELNKTYKPKNVELDTSKNQKLKLTNAVCQPVKDENYTYFASTLKDGYISLEMDTKGVDYLYIDLDHIDGYTRTEISYLNGDNDPITKENTIKMEFNPIKKKYIIDFKGKAKEATKIRINIDKEPNKELSIKEMKVYNSK